jgi:short-subunit dehydrogenase
VYEERVTARRRTHRARAVVTGAGSGIGRAFALELARRGGRVVCVDLHEETAADTASQIGSAGGDALALQCDVSSAEDVSAVKAATERWLGEAPSLLVNNAGIGAGGLAIGESSLADWRRTLDVNLWGAIHFCHHFVPAVRAARTGGIINVASAAGFTASPNMAAYNVSKAGVVSLSETLRAELSDTDVAVTVLCPTFVQTDIFRGELIDAASGRLGHKIARAIGFSPERVARITLDAHDRGDLYVLPQADAKALWHSKRLFPSSFARFTGFLGRLAPRPTR